MWYFEKQKKYLFLNANAFKNQKKKIKGIDSNAVVIIRWMKKIRYRHEKVVKYFDRMIA